MYTPHTKPFDHQRQAVADHAGDRHWGHLWEQGTGKTKAIIDQFGTLYDAGEVKSLLVIAPGGVAPNWITDELPTHWPPDLPLTSWAYRTGSAGAKYHKRAIEGVIKAPHASVLAMTYDAFMTDLGKKAAWALMQKRPCLAVLDESARIKTPGIKRTQSLVRSARWTPYRRILTGTPVLQGPFDVYSQVRYLDGQFWKRELDLATFSDFKAFFGVWDKGYNSKTDTWYDDLVTYQNLPLLAELMATITDRVTKDEVLDLPPKLYEKRYYTMLPDQARIYRDLREDFLTWLDSGDLVTAPLAITRLLRLQQVLCGYLPADGDAKPTMLMEPSKNPRLRLLGEVIEDAPQKVIIWARFQQDITNIMKLLGDMGRRPVRYDGLVSDRDRAANKEAFQSGEATDFVANPAAAGEGLTLHASSHVVYYNNSFKLGDRLQSEDRAHRIGQTRSVTYLDLICEDTVDVGVVDALRNKRDIAEQLLGDAKREWL